MQYSTKQWKTLENIERFDRLLRKTKGKIIIQLIQLIIQLNGFKKNEDDEENQRINLFYLGVSIFDLDK